jgi:hypothetical protein
MLAKLSALLLAVSLAPVALADDWQLVINQAVDLPFGASVSRDYYLNLEGEYSALKVELRDDGGARCDGVTAEVDVAHAATRGTYTTYQPDAEGIVQLGAPGVIFAKFHNRQDVWRTGYCRRMVWLKAGTDGDTPALALFGALAYDGGFDNAVDVTPTRGDERPFVAQIVVRLPEFCTGVEILEVGTVTEGVYEAATLVDADEHVYDVNGGSGTRISAIKLTLNGPRTSACDIPVYVR